MKSKISISVALLALAADAAELTAPKIGVGNGGATTELAAPKTGTGVRPPATAEATATKVSERYFGTLARLTPVPKEDGSASDVQQAAIGPKVVGWVFRTDTQKPVVLGKRGEIATWVALGADGLVKGIEVAEHKEDKQWFDRLKKSYYRQFEGLPGNGSGKRPDTVATATISSKAIVDDVLGACTAVLEMPAVKAAMPKPALPKLTLPKNGQTDPGVKAP